VLGQPVGRKVPGAQRTTGHASGRRAPVRGQLLLHRGLRSGGRRRGGRGVLDGRRPGRGLGRQRCHAPRSRRHLCGQFAGPDHRFLSSGRRGRAHGGQRRGRAGARRQRVDHCRLHDGRQQQPVGVVGRRLFSDAAHTAAAAAAAADVTVDRCQWFFHDRGLAVYSPRRSLRLLLWTNEH